MAEPVPAGASPEPRGRTGLPALLAAAVLAAGLAGCETQQAKNEATMSGLLAVLPGRYDNTAQVQAEARSGARPAHDPVALLIVHVYTPRLGRHVYYAMETAADNPQRIFSQKMYSFTVDDKLGIVETLYEFAEPNRWLAGLQDKDLFTSITREDVRPEACLLYWKKTDDGFAAHHDPRVCPDEGSGATPAAQLSAGVLTIGDYKFRRTR